jgi:alpha-beta hydrolase superfamily lysophospholipase
MHEPLRPPSFDTMDHRDGYRAIARVWPAQGEPSPRTGVLYLHGIQSHGGWYEWSASVLAELGHVVILPDRRGSGLNNAARGDVRQFSRWLDDVDDWLDYGARRYGVRDWRLAGISWGGKLAAAHAMLRPGRAGRLLLIAPGVFPRVDVAWAEKVRIGLSVLFSPTACFDVPLQEPALFTDSAAGQRFIATDTQKLARVTARFLYESRKLDGLIRRGSFDGFVRAANRSLAAPPLWLLTALNDRIIDSERTLQWFERAASAASSRSIRLHGAHTLEFESDRGAFETALREFASGC